MGVIADMIRAGIDPDMIERVAQQMVETARHGLPVRTAQQERNARYYDAHKDRLKASKASENVLIKTPDVTELPPEVSPQRDIIKPPILTPHPKPTRAKPKSQLAEDAQPTAGDLDAAKSAGMTPAEVRSEWRAFRDHHRSKGNLMADWSAAWRTWLRNHERFRSRAGPRSAPPARETSLTRDAAYDLDEPHDPSDHFAGPTLDLAARDDGSATALV